MALEGESSGCGGNLILLGVTLVTLAVLWALAGSYGWNRDRTLWIGLGAFLAVMTVTRPWWFWENYKARWLRQAVGDELTALLYLLVSGAMLWIGLYTNWTFGHR